MWRCSINYMAIKRLFIASVALSVVLGGVSRVVNGQHNLATVPPSSISDGTVATPRSIGVNGNLIITGNVSGGRHFRGTVPYGATTDFGATLGSSSLDSFLRRSAGLESSGLNRWKYAPYYSPSRTVTTTSPGQSGVIGPQVLAVSGRAEDRAALSARTARDVFLSGDLQFRQQAELYGSYGLAPTTSQAAYRNVLTELDRLSGNVTPTGSVEQMGYRGLSQRLSRREIARQRLRDQSVSEEGMRLDAESTGYPEGLNSLSPEVRGRGEPTELRESFLQGRELQADRGLGSPEGLPNQGEAVQPGQATVQRVDRSRLSEAAWRDVLQRERQIESEVEVQERALPPYETIEATEGRVDGYESARTGTETVEAKVPGQGVLEQFGTNLTNMDSMPTFPGVQGKLLNTDVYAGTQQEGGFPESYPYLSLGGVDLPGALPGATPYRESAKAIMGVHSTFASFTEAKSSEYKMAGEDYFERGMYYRAADSYAMASIYKPDDAFAYAGRSHALFAAGEYMSSALYLARALEILAGVDSAQQGVWSTAAESAGKSGETKAVDVTPFAANLMTIDRDKLESRLVDIEAWQEKTDSGELLFLAGYIYYQMGRPERAREVLGQASQKMPGTQAVMILKRTIESSSKNQP